MKNDARAQMAGLAAHLGNKRKVILTRWRTTTEEAPGVTIASSLTRVQFNDHLPGDPAKVLRPRRVTMRSL